MIFGGQKSRTDLLKIMIYRTDGGVAVIHKQTTNYASPMGDDEMIDDKHAAA